VIFGPESTGKTTLAGGLAGRFGESWSSEYVRRFWDEHGGRIGASDLEAIGRGQVAAEDAAERSARRAVFCDTDLLTCTLWNDLLFPGCCPPWEREEAELRARRTALYLLCLTDVPFLPDPQRCFPDAEGRAMCMRLWKQTLVERSLPFVEIGGPWPARLGLAVNAVEALLGRP
jgi:NadR type nicotinamide-nucleotide adenylyltransferase